MSRSKEYAIKKIIEYCEDLTLNDVIEVFYFIRDKILKKKRGG